MSSGRWQSLKRYAEQSWASVVGNAAGRPGTARRRRAALAEGQQALEPGRPHGGRAERSASPSRPWRRPASCWTRSRPCVDRCRRPKQQPARRSPRPRATWRLRRRPSPAGKRGHARPAGPGRACPGAGSAGARRAQAGRPGRREARDRGRRHRRSTPGRGAPGRGATRQPGAHPRSAAPIGRDGVPAGGSLHRRATRGYGLGCAHPARRGRAPPGSGTCAGDLRSRRSTVGGPAGTEPSPSRRSRWRSRTSRRSTRTAAGGHGARRGDPDPVPGPDGRRLGWRLERRRWFWRRRRRFAVAAAVPGAAPWAGAGRGAPSQRARRDVLESQDVDRESGLTMAQSILGRIGQLVRANVNALLDSAEDPERCSNSSSATTRTTSARRRPPSLRRSANLRLLEEDQREAVEAVQEWTEKAQAASRKADELRASGQAAEADRFDNLARIALRRQISYEDQAKTLERAGPPAARLHGQAEGRT